MRRERFFGKKVIAAATAALMGVTVLAGGLGSTAYVQAASDKKELKEIRIGVPGQGDTYAMENMSLAYTEGYLEEELNAAGYTAKFTAFMQTGPEVNEALASDSLDGAVYADFPAIVSNSNGVKSTIIAEANSKVQYGILTASDDIEEPKDLEGKKVIVGQGTILQYFWEKYVEDNKLDKSKIEIVNGTDAASLLQTKQADAYVSTLSGLYYMESRGLGKVFADGSQINGAESTMVVTLSDKFLKDNEDAAVAINKALIRAYETAQESPEKFYDAIATKDIPADVAKKAYETDTTLSNLSPEITEDTQKHYEDLENWMADNQLIAEKPDVSKLVNITYYEKAQEELKNEQN